MPDNDSSVGSKRGRIVSFYSYKGGVGRSMALANVAILLARNGKRVLVVDWDLEAPGLESYFKIEVATISTPTKPGGLLSLLESDSRKNPTGWRSFTSAVSFKSESTTFDFLSSGFKAPDYSERLAEFSWSRYFAKRRGADLLERLRDDWMRTYHFVLLDSRTGLADSSGICTIQMPDWLVLVFAANDQNINGCQRVAWAARAERRNLPYDRPHLTVFPVLSRFDAPEEAAAGKKWMEEAADKFAPFYAEWLPKSISPRKVLDWMRLPYLRVHALGEDLPVLDASSLSDPHGLGFYYNIIAQLLTSGFRNLRKILTAVGVEDARLSLLPPENILRTQLQTDHGYARRQMVEIADFAEEDIESVLFALERLADYSEKFQPSESEEILRRIVSLAHRYNREKPEETVRLYVRHADLLTGIGREEEALEQYLAALSAAQNSFGAMSPQYVSTLIALANFRANAKKFGRSLIEAERSYRKALKYAEKIFVNSEPILANYLVAFAVFLAQVGRERENSGQKIESLAKLNRAMAIYQGADLRGNIASTASLEVASRQRYFLLIELGQYKDALKSAEEMVARVENDRGRILSLCDALEEQGWVHEYLGEYSQAKFLYERSLRLKEDNWGKSSIRYGVACVKLADVLYTMGDYQEAEMFCWQAITIYEKSFGANSAEAVSAYAILAEIFGITGRRADAEKHLQRALKVRVRAFGREDHTVAVTYAHLGLLLHEEQRYEEAASYHQKALEIDIRLYGDKHPEVAYDQLNLLSALSKLRKPEKRNRTWQKNLSILTKAFGTNHEVVARKRVQYAEYLHGTKQFEAAFRELKTAIHSLKTIFSATHRYTLDAEAVFNRLEGTGSAEVRAG